MLQPFSVVTFKNAVAMPALLIIRIDSLVNHQTKSQW